MRGCLSLRGSRSPRRELDAAAASAGRGGSWTATIAPTTNAVLLVGCIVAAIAGAVHVHILVLENVL